MRHITVEAQLSQEAEEAKRLVLEKEPSAFADDDGEWVRIGVKRPKTSQCRECKRSWTREEIVIGQSMGAAGGAERAWIDAANNLGLTK